MSVLAGMARRIYPLLCAALGAIVLSVSAQAQLRPAVGVSSNQLPGIPPPPTEPRSLRSPDQTNTESATINSILSTSTAAG